MSNRSAITRGLLSLLLLIAAACDPGPQNGQPAQPAPSGGLLRQPVTGTFTRYTRRSATAGWTQLSSATPAVLILSTTWCASPRSIPDEEDAIRPPAPVMDPEHVTEVVLERVGARRCLARVEGLDGVLQSSSPATVRFVRNEQTGRIEGALSVAGRDLRQDLEVKLVVEFAADGPEQTQP